MPWMTDEFVRLCDACRVGDLDAARALLDAGTDQNADPGQPRGWSPLMTAAYYGHLDVARLLVERGAKLDAIEIDRWWTALDLANHGGHPEIVKYLKSVGAKRGGPRQD